MERAAHCCYSCHSTEIPPGLPRTASRNPWACSQHVVLSKQPVALEALLLEVHTVWQHGESRLPPPRWEVAAQAWPPEPRAVTAPRELHGSEGEELRHPPETGRGCRAAPGGLLQRPGGFVPRKCRSCLSGFPWSSLASGPWVPATKAVGVRGHANCLARTTCLLCLHRAHSSTNCTHF